MTKDEKRNKEIKRLKDEHEKKRKLVFDEISEVSTVNKLLC